MLKLISKGSGEGAVEARLWELEGDPETFITRDDTYETWCDDVPHPMKLSKADWAEWRTMSDWDKTQLSRTNWERYSAHVNRKRGYLCPGNSEHSYSMWTVQVAGEWLHDGAFDKFAHAVAALEDALGEKVKLSIPRKPKRTPRETVINETTGAATWTVCGHRAEMDINEDCYTCHGAV